MNPIHTDTYNFRSLKTKYKPPNLYFDFLISSKNTYILQLHKIINSIDLWQKS